MVTKDHPRSMSYSNLLHGCGLSKPNTEDLKGTTTRPDRDQVLRNLDVGTYHAGVRDFYFSLLVASEDESPLGWQKLGEYSNFEVVRSRLPHRRDGLANLKGPLGKLTWLQLENVLCEAGTAAERPDEREYATRAVKWLQTRAIT